MRGHACMHPVHLHACGRRESSGLCASHPAWTTTQAVQGRRCRSGRTVIISSLLARGTRLTAQGGPIPGHPNLAQRASPSKTHWLAWPHTTEQEGDEQRAAGRRASGGPHSVRARACATTLPRPRQSQARRANKNTQDGRGRVQCTSRTRGALRPQCQQTSSAETSRRTASLLSCLLTAVRTSDVSVGFPVKPESVTRGGLLLSVHVGDVRHVYSHPRRWRVRGLPVPDRPD